MNKIRLLAAIILPALFVLALFRAGWTIFESQKYLLRAADVPTLSLNNEERIDHLWPVFDSLPDRFSHPETGYSAGTFDSTLLGEPSISSTVDGLRQTWTDANLNFRATVEYGCYDKPEQARNGVLYITYTKSLSRPDWNSTQPYVYQNYFLCRKAPFGDLGFSISGGYGGYSLIFCIDNCIFFITSYDPDLSESMANKILARK